MGAGDSWAQGAAIFEIGHRWGAYTLHVGVRCRFGGLESEELALLDTGAEWSVVNGELAEQAGDMSSIGESIRISSRLGLLDGTLHRTDIHLVCDRGQGLTVDGTVLVVPDWPGPPVLGYRGLLEHMRFALDPGGAPNEPWFYFGMPGSEDDPDPRLLTG